MCVWVCVFLLGFLFCWYFLYVVYNNNNSVYICKECQCMCVCRLFLSFCFWCVCKCLCVCLFLVFNNLRANRLGQWILSDAYLVALCAIIQGAWCVSCHICPIAIPTIAILYIQFLCRFVCIVVIPTAAAAAGDAAATADAAAVDSRLAQSIANAQA